MPETAELTVSGNIIKNVKSVIVPHTNGRKGLQAAVAVGICCGDGLVANDVEKTIKTVSTIAREGMRETDNEIIHFMIENN